jgi:hypothetical protein
MVLDEKCSGRGSIHHEVDIVCYDWRGVAIEASVVYSVYVNLFISVCYDIANLIFPSFISLHDDSQFFTASLDHLPFLARLLSHFCHFIFYKPESIQIRGPYV